VEYCPVKYPDQYNQDISLNKAVHVYFAQAIPLITYIDESCLYLKEKKCRICEAVCKNDAIDLNQKPEKKDINVGAIILAPGFEPFDPKVREEYRYGEFQNVVTSIQFETDDNGFPSRTAEVHLTAAMNRGDATGNRSVARSASPRPTLAATAAKSVPSSHSPTVWIPTTRRSGPRTESRS